MRIGLLILGSMAVLACGPAVGGGTETDSTSAASSSSTADESSGSAAMCEDYANEEASSPVPMVIVNDTDGFLMLEVNCGLDFLEMADEMGGTYPGDFCSMSCEDEFEFGCIVCDGCATDSYHMVAPGETYELEWPGYLYEHVSPPRDCFSEEFCSESCQVVRGGEARGMITARVTAVLQADCEADAEDPATCICGADRDCDFHYAPPSGGAFATTTVETSFTADTPSPVLIEFG